MGFFYFKVLLVPEILALQWPIVLGAMGVTFSDKQRGLLTCLSLCIDVTLDDLFSVVQALVLFV